MSLTENILREFNCYENMDIITINNNNNNNSYNKNNNIAIAWIKLTVGAKSMGAKTKPILNGISGCFASNSINGLMGSSGSGKSTLLKTLNGSHKYCSSDESKIFVKNDAKMRSIFIYQDQEEKIMTGFTVEQALTYSSRIKNSSLSGINHKDIVNELMDELMINDIKDNQIDRCSGGQIKRLSIGLELTSVEKPNMMFIDEPTTGLDSNAAEVVIESLKRLKVNHKMTTIVSIHQPNNELFNMFDNIYVLAKGGVCVYSGPPTALRQHLISCNIECNENQVPIEVLIKLSSEGIQNNRVKQLSDKTKVDISYKVNDLNELTIKKNKTQSTKSFNVLDFWYLLLRFFHRNYVSNFNTIVKQFLLYVVMIVLSFNVFSDKIFQTDGCFQLNTVPNMTCAQQRQEDTNLVNNLTLTCLLIVFSTILLFFSIVISYINDMKIFFSEHKNLWYSSGAFFWSKLIFDISMTAIYSALFILALQFVTHQFSDLDKFLKLTQLIFLSFLCLQFMASIVSITFCGNLNVCVFMLQILLINVLFFNNLTMKMDPNKHYLTLMAQFDIYYYTFHSLMILIYGFNRCPNGYLSKTLIENHLQENNEMIFDQYLEVIWIYLSVMLFLQFLVFFVKIQRFSFNFSKYKFENLFTDESVHINISDIPTIEFEQDQTLTPQKTDIFIQWKDLTYSVSPLFVKTNSKVLLNQISGYFETNSLNAVMGPSGAGKTTLLKCLSGMNKRGLSDDTEIYFNSKRVLKTCFILQNVSDHLLEGLTVRQTLFYASKLKNSRFNTDLDHNKNIDELMSKLLISDISENRVETCSGGERKRIVIASELTSYIKPNLLCIDEPTSGLDSNAAEKIISLLKQISQKYEMTTIVSIHQPNNDLFQMFDKLYIMAKGGVCVYTGSSNGLKEHLIDSKINVKKNQFPIEVILKISAEEKTNESLNNLIQKSKCKSPDNMQSFHINRENNEPSKRFSGTDFYHLLLRTITFKYQRQWKEVLLLFFIFIVIGLSMRFIVNPDMVNPNGCLEIDFSIGCNQTLHEIESEFLIKQNLRYHFFLTMGLTIVMVGIHSLTFCADFKLLQIQNNNGWYSTGAFFWSKFIVDLIPDLISILIFSWIISFYVGWRINIVYFFTMFMIVLCNQSLAQISATLNPDSPKIALSIAIVGCCFLVLFSDILIPSRNLHYALQYLSEVSYFKLSIDLIVISIYGFDRCFENEISLVLYGLGIKTQMFGKFVINLTLICVVLKLLTVCVLYFKINYNLKDNRNKLENKQDLSTRLRKLVF